MRKRAGDTPTTQMLNKYETFHRADGKTVKLHMDQGEGQHWNSSPGNLTRSPKDHRQARRRPIAISLTEVIPPIPDAGRHQVHPPHPHPERAADQVLGPAHVSERHCAGARGL
jgi:hypothetical protein